MLKLSGNGNECKPLPPPRFHSILGRGESFFARYSPQVGRADIARHVIGE